MCWSNKKLLRGKSAIYHSIKPPFDVEVAEKFLKGINNKWLAHSMARCNRMGSDCWLSEVAWVIKISNCCEWHWYRPRYRNIIVLPLCLSSLTLRYALLMSFITCNYSAWNYSWQFYNRSPELWMIQFCVNNSFGHPQWLYMVLSTNKKYSFCYNFFFWAVRNRCPIST